MSHTTYVSGVSPRSLFAALISVNGQQRICAEPWRLACRAPSRSVSCTNPCTNLVAARGHHRSGDRFRVRDYRLGPLSARSQVRPRSMYPSLVMRLREGLLHRAGGGHDHLTSTTLPAGCTIKPPDAGSRQCLWVTALLREQLASSIPSGSWPKLTPTGQHAWRDTNRSSGACSNACGRTGSNRSATRSPSLLTLLCLSRAHRRIHRPGEVPVELAGDVALEAAADLPWWSFPRRCAGRRRRGSGGSCASGPARWHGSHGSAPGRRRG